MTMTVRYEDIKLNKLTYYKQRILYFYALAFAGFLLTIQMISNGNADGMVITGICFFFFMILAINSTKNFAYIETFHSGWLRFYNNNPSKTAFDEFVKKVQDHVKQQLINKYGKVDADIPEDVYYSRLRYLVERNAISEAEAEERKEDYQIKRLIG
jgi:hypothetical protein